MVEINSIYKAGITGFINDAMQKLFQEDEDCACFDYKKLQEFKNNNVVQMALLAKENSPYLTKEQLEEFKNLPLYYDGENQFNSEVACYFVDDHEEKTRLVCCEVLKYAALKGRLFGFKIDMKNEEEKQ